MSAKHIYIFFAEGNISGDTDGSSAGAAATDHGIAAAALRQAERQRDDPWPRVVF